MKLKASAIILAFVILAVSACTQRTCPTYSKQDVNTVNLSK
jgi:hypothetical protein